MTQILLSKKALIGKIRIVIAPSSIFTLCLTSLENYFIKISNLKYFRSKFSLLINDHIWDNALYVSLFFLVKVRLYYMLNIYDTDRNQYLSTYLQNAFHLIL